MGYSGSLYRRPHTDMTPIPAVLLTVCGADWEVVEMCRDYCEHWIGFHVKLFCPLFPSSSL